MRKTNEWWITFESFFGNGSPCIVFHKGRIFRRLIRLKPKKRIEIKQSETWWNQEHCVSFDWEPTNLKRKKKKIKITGRYTPSVSACRALYKEVVAHVTHVTDDNQSCRNEKKEKNESEINVHGNDKERKNENESLALARRLTRRGTHGRWPQLHRAPQNKLTLSFLTIHGAALWQCKASSIQFLVINETLETPQTQPDTLQQTHRGIETSKIEKS